MYRFNRDTLYCLLGKFGAIFASIPASIMAAVYCIFFGYICMYLLNYYSSFLLNATYFPNDILPIGWLAASAGLGFLQFCNLNSFRTNFILGFSLFLGFSLPQYFRERHACSVSGPLHTHSRWVITNFHPLNVQNKLVLMLFLLTVVQWHNVCHLHVTRYDSCCSCCILG